MAICGTEPFAEKPIGLSVVKLGHNSEFYYTNAEDNKQYHIVRGCIPTDIPIDECGLSSVNLSITVA